MTSGLRIATSYKPTRFSLQSHAVYSDCGAYRFRLWRVLAGGQRRGIVAFVMLNPSTATEEQNDPTVERCERRAVSMGFDRYDIVNLFALRSTNPKALLNHRDPVGSGNVDHILEACDDASMIIAAWGAHGNCRHAQGTHVGHLLRTHYGDKLFALGVTQSGQPRHPLYTPYANEPQPWRPLPNGGKT